MELTKQQERDALDQITAILEAAGPDSYIGMAFRGCVEIARQNIENDFGDSLADRASNLAAQLDKVTRQRDEMRRDIECSTRAMQAEMDNVNKRLEETTQERDKLSTARRDLEAAKAALEAQMEQAQAENVRLKARLYDILMADRPAG